MDYASILELTDEELSDLYKEVVSDTEGFTVGASDKACSYCTCLYGHLNCRAKSIDSPHGCVCIYTACQNYITAPSLHGYVYAASATCHYWDLGCFQGYSRICR